MEVSKDIYYIGVNDHNIDLFEGQYDVPHGMAYNSYVILDEKIAVLDTVDAHFTDEWLNNLEVVLNGRKPDYLIIQHMEPDHSANIQNFMKVYPETVIVGNTKTFVMLEQFFDIDISIKKQVVKNNETLCLGTHTLTFVFAPMVHWPEVMMTYDNIDKVVFSADAFGKFGANDIEEEWACEARRYYFGIVGKYGTQVQAVLKKLADLDIQIICPLHGPVLKDNLDEYIHLYDLWSSYQVESQGVVIAYTSVYGNTKKAVQLLVEQLKANGCPKVSVHDLARDDMAEAVEDAFRYNQLVLATTTYNNDIFPFMKEFIHHLKEKNYQNRQIAFIENGSWAPMAAKVMNNMLSDCKNITFVETLVTIQSAMKASTEEKVCQLAKELCKDYQ
ncbi:MAG: FprA family A-type flavoprotein [Coprobacillus sp.]|nr:FprA family A-type flavoprotein [Coprobacillus sp.]